MPNKLPESESGISNVEMPETNPEHLPLMHRNIASTVIFSSDGKVLLGRKDSKGGGVYSDSWHLPGGGVEPRGGFDDAASESLIEAAARELGEEVVGLDADQNVLEALPGLRGSGATTKIFKDGTKAWCEMDFNYFRLASKLTSEELAGILEPGSDFVELRFFAPEELSELDTMPGGIEEQIINGNLTPTSSTSDN